MCKYILLVVLLFPIYGCYYVATRLIQQPITEQDYVNGRMLYVNRADAEFHVRTQIDSDAIYFIISGTSKYEPFIVPLTGFYISVGGEKYYPLDGPTKMWTEHQSISENTTISQRAGVMITFTKNILNQKMITLHLPEIKDSRGRVVEDFSEIVFINKKQLAMLTING